MPPVHRICIATGGRADWGLLTPLAHALNADKDVDLQIIATNMHLSERFGMTVDEITGAGFKVSARVPMDCTGDTPGERVQAMAQCMSGMGNALEQMKPDCLIILGDRYEMLATACAAAMLRIPVVHIAGGTISRGAVDDNMRHAITKLSALHLVETECAAQRVIQMGEKPENVVVTGAPGVYNILHVPLWNQEKLTASLDGFVCDDSTLLVTYHPATLDNAVPEERMDQLLAALDRFPQNKVLFTFPNNDAGGDRLARRIMEYAAVHPERTKAVKSLGMVRYLSCLQFVAAVVGNSSSGIVEVPSMHIPTVDIGIRQDGRERANSVIHSGDTADEITQAIRYALSPEGKALARETVNPYFHPDTIRCMTTSIKKLLEAPSVVKTFYDLPVCQNRQ